MQLIPQRKPLQGFEDVIAALLQVLWERLFDRGQQHRVPPDLPTSVSLDSESTPNVGAPCAC